MLELIGIVQHREITANLLDINDNMNNELLRFERYMNNCGEKSKVKDPEALSPDEILLQVPQGKFSYKEDFFNNKYLCPLCLLVNKILDNVLLLICAWNFLYFKLNPVQSVKSVRAQHL